MNKLGIDLGSSTAKVVVLNDRNELLFKTYQRHHGRVKESLLKILKEIQPQFAEEKFTVQVTGSAGMGLAARTDLPFVQEVIALTRAIRTFYPQTNTFIELGGEDAKIVLFNGDKAPEMKMNGSCAGGTGSFIDQMATLLNVSLMELNELAGKATKNLYIASRCGVFAKTDVQALLNKGEAKEDIAKAVFTAVANQAITSLLAGAEVKPKIVFAGGPLTFLPELRNAFKQALELPDEDFILAQNSEVLVAVGAALNSEKNSVQFSLKEILSKLEHEKAAVQTIRSLPPLFKNKKDYEVFKQRHDQFKIRKLTADEIAGSKEFYLGIDAGSTTTKLILINENNNIVDGFYSQNNGSPLETVKEGLLKFKQYFELGRLKAAFATGYGEEFVKVAFNLDGGIVETMAHFSAGSLFDDQLSYIIDVGGQDIKAIKIENGIITDIQLNEACSSGTGSFIQTFAEHLNLSLDEFVRQAMFAKNPVDLGTRCSVFMNSKVKEALKDGIPIADIAAGLAYSVVKNALYKVIKIRNPQELGEHVFVQGGTFKNEAVLRAFELLTGKQVIRLNISEYMGAYGAALYAKKFYQQNKGYQSKFRPEYIENIDYQRRELHCHGCGNNCIVTQFTFPNKNRFYTGNRCERYFSNKTVNERIKRNYFREKEEFFFNAEKFLDSHSLPAIDAQKPVIGIPRVLAVYEHYPFFYAFFRKLGFKVVLSDYTSQNMYYKGLRTVAADNVCLPAKVAHGHILDLLEKKVDRIFVPSIIFEAPETKDAKNTYNCPIVTGYGEVLKTQIKSDVPIDSFPMSFTYLPGVRKRAFEYLKEFGVTQHEVNHAVQFGLLVEKEVIKKQKELGAQIIEQARSENKPLIVVMGRPYHQDPFINTGILDLIYDLGAYAIPESAIPNLHEMNLQGVLPLTQWSYHNRLYLAAKWLIQQKYEKMAAIQLNSFGCGPDAIVTDEVKSIVESGGRIYISIKIDEMSNLGAAKIRIRSLLEALNQNKEVQLKPRSYTKPYSKQERKKTILVPNFSTIYSKLLEPVFHHLGYKIETIYDQTPQAVETGLKYVNNDMCYPAIVVIGDVLKALQSGKYNPDETVVALSQTNGQCRASNYVPLLKKALIEAGFKNTPVISLSTDSFKEGFRFNPIKFLKYSVTMFAIADALHYMRLKTKPYEVKKGETLALLKELTNALRKQAFQKVPDKKLILSFLPEAIKRFNAIDVHYDRPFPRVGVVGEIYLKTNCFSNNHLLDWLESRGREVEMPAMLDFFEYGYFTGEFNQQEEIQKMSWGQRLIKRYYHHTIVKYRKLVDQQMKQFDRYEAMESLEEAIESTDLTPAPLYLKFGEGWLLPMEIAEMSRRGVKDVISVQPFGCISNHIVAKGLYRKLKEEYDVNMLLLDFESGTSEVNNQNRLELFLSLNS